MLQQITISKMNMVEPEIIHLSPKWVNFIKFVKLHPYVKFKRLEFKEGDPFIGVLPLYQEEEMQIEESKKF